MTNNEVRYGYIIIIVRTLHTFIQNTDLLKIVKVCLILPKVLL